MSSRLTLSIDAMGGDAAPKMVVDGVQIAAKWLPQVDFLLFGRENEIKPLVDAHRGLGTKTRVRHADDVVTNDEKPSAALRSGRNSSMRLAINAVKNGEASGIVSAGNTGALMAMAKFVLRTLPGIDRPAIATYFPTIGGAAVMLDLGANVDCDADNLVQFAVMGEVFARNVLGKDKPTVGLLNVGSEEVKGNESVKMAAQVLENSDLPIEYHGFVEGDDIGKGTVDVIVTDGFTGNVALKVMEGTAKLLTTFMRNMLVSSPLSRLGTLFLLPSLRQLKQKLDPKRYNGAMFLGIDGVCVKSHGGTDAEGFANAIKVAVEMITDRLNESIKEDFSKISEMSNEPKQSAAG